MQLLKVDSGTIYTVDTRTLLVNLTMLERRNTFFPSYSPIVGLESSIKLQGACLAV